MEEPTIQQAVCTKCGTPKPLTDFAQRRNRPMGRSSWCRECQRENNRLRSKTPHGREVDRRLKKQPKYKVRRNELRRQKYSREYDNARKARYRQHPEYPERRKRYNAKRWIYRIREKYGLTRDEYEAMVKRQGGVCAICLMPQAGKRTRLHVDHDHQTNEIRGLLCNRCNTAIGQMRDSPEIAARASEYLRKHAQLRLVV